MGWIIKEPKRALNASKYLEVMTVDFPLVGASLVWKVGNESEIKIGKDAIMGYGQKILLLDALVEILQVLG